MRAVLRTLAAALLIATLPIPALRADDLLVKFDRINGTVSIDATNADVGAVIQQLFSQAGGARYDLDPAIKGNITLHLKNAKPESVLQSVLNQVGATYQTRNGLYSIRSAKTASGSGKSPVQRETMQLRSVNFAQAAQQIGEKFGKKVRVKSDVPGRVNLTLDSSSFEEAMSSLVRSAGGSQQLEWRSEGDYIVIIPIDSLPKSSDVPAIFRSPVDVNARRRPIAEVTSVMSRETGVAVLYDKELPGDIIISVMAKRETFWTVLQRIAIAAALKIEITGPKEVTLHSLTTVSATYKGRHVGSVNEDYGQCRHCKYDVKKEWRYCPMCGEKLGQ